MDRSEDFGRTAVKCPDEYTQIREKLMFQVLMQKENEAIAEDLPCRTILDMFLICRIRQYNYSSVSSNPVITREMLQRWDITEDRLFEDALKMVPRNQPPVFRRMEDMLREFIDPEKEVVKGGNPLYVASVQNRLYGASVIVYPGFLKSAADYVGGNYYIIPSSVHEILILPEPYAPGVDDLETIIVQINEAVVEPSDRLSDHVYHYDRSEGLLETGREYLLRTGIRASDQSPETASC